ncbi:hypothetical protein LA304_04040 [Celeribacter sp. ASW11-22]|nr:hypothetical protein [Celeribacter litoreus]
MNDCTPGDPLDTFQTIELGSQVRGTPFRNRHAHAKNLKKIRSEWKLQIASYEDQVPRMHVDAAMERWTQGYPKGTVWKNLLIVRSFPNWLASFYKLVTEREAGTPRGVKSPLEIASFILRYKQLLTQSVNQPDKITAVFFDQWVVDATYRSGLLAQIGLDNLDNSVGETSKYGGGSSFAPSTSKDAKANSRGNDLQQRWRMMLDEPAFVALLNLAFADAGLRKLLEQTDLGFSDLESEFANLGREVLA